jgi:hypothetical protein
MDARKCDGFTLQMRDCKRRASVLYVLKNGSEKAFCPQHASGMGAMRYLRPYPWDVAERTKLTKEAT